MGANVNDKEAGKEKTDNYTLLGLYTVHLYKL